MRGLRIVLVLVAIASASAADAHEQANFFDAISARVRRAVTSHDYAALGTMAENYRTADTRSPAGIAYLSTFYKWINYYVSHLDDCPDCAGRPEAFVANWLRQRPHDPAAIILEAKILTDRAGELRGDGEADTVPEAAWPQIDKDIELARQHMLAARRFADVDPEWFATMVEIALLDPASPDWVKLIFQEGVTRFPTYMPIYRAMATYLLPQSFGDYAEIDAMARAAAAAAVPEADGSYARIYRMVDEICDCTKPLREETAIDWPMMTRSMRAMVARFPDEWNFSTFARLSCEARDFVEARFYINQMHIRPEGYFVVGTDGQIACPVDATEFRPA